MQPKTKATARSVKKGKSVRKSVPVVQSDNDVDTDWASDEELSMRDTVRNLTAMMTTMNARLNQMDGGGRKRRKVSAATHGTEAATLTLAPKPLQTSTSLPLDFTTAPAQLPASEHATPGPMTSVPLTAPQDLAPLPAALPPLSHHCRTSLRQCAPGWCNACKG